MTDDQSFMDDIRRIDSALGSATAVDAAPPLDQICELLAKVRGPLQAVLPFIERIPVYGPTIAKTLRLLLQFGDAVCPR